MILPIWHLPLLIGTALSSSFLDHRDVLPSRDAWYAAPKDFEAASPGQVLKIRRAPGNLTVAYANVSETYNILFRTTDSNYKPSWAVTTVFVPSTPKDNALVSYQIPYNTADVYESPSFQLNSDAYTKEIIGSDINALLAQGWHVNVPDHEGPLASFACLVSEGHATLDSIRAVISSRATIKLSASPRATMWGYSGGSIASEAAAELQVQYAPELAIAGVALGGLVPNTTNALRHTNKSVFSGLIPSILVGWSTQHPAILAQLNADLKSTGPHNASTFWEVKHFGFGQEFSAFQFQDLWSYFKNGESFLQTAAVRETNDRDGTLGFHGVPQSPLYIYKAIHDQLSTVSDTDDVVSRYCSVGANILYERNTVGGHLAEETNGDARALDWLRSVNNGSYNHTGCTVRDVTISIDTSPI